MRYEYERQDQKVSRQEWLQNKPKEQQVANGNQRKRIVRYPTIRLSNYPTIQLSDYSTESQREPERRKFDELRALVASAPMKWQTLNTKQIKMVTLFTLKTATVFVFVGSAATRNKFSANSSWLSSFAAAERLLDL